MSVYAPDEQQLVKDVQVYGWHTVGIEEDDEGPPFVYSVGLYRTLGHPEIVITGLDPFLGHDVLSTIVPAIRSGERYAAEAQYEEILEDCACAFTGVGREFYRRHLGYGLWFYDGAFPALQCVWPDKGGRYPWDDEALPWFRMRQPLLHPELVHLSHWIDPDLLQEPDWSFLEPRNTAVFTTRGVIRDGLPVREVFHDGEDDAWQFLPGSTFRMEDALLVGLGELVERDPTLADVSSLPPGWRAWREGPGAPWLRAPHDGE